MEQGTQPNDSSQLSAPAPTKGTQSQGRQAQESRSVEDRYLAILTLSTSNLYFLFYHVFPPCFPNIMLLHSRIDISGEFCFSRLLEFPKLAAELGGWPRLTG